MTTLTRNKWKAKVLLNLFYTETLFLHSGVILDQKVIHAPFSMIVKKKQEKKKTMHIIFSLVRKAYLSIKG